MPWVPDLGPPVGDLSTEKSPAPWDVQPSDVGSALSSAPGVTGGMEDDQPVRICTELADSFTHSAAISRAASQGEIVRPNRSMSKSFLPKDSGQREVAYPSAFVTICRTETSQRHPILRTGRQVLNSNYTETFIALIIIANFFLIIIDTDARASSGGSSGENVPAWVDMADFLCFAVFVVELLARFACENRPYREMFQSTWFVMDTIIVVVGALDYLARILVGLRLEVVRFLRLVRLLRILRVLRLFSVLRELKRLIQMMGGCFKTLFWSCLLLLVVMTTWSVIAVDLVNPYILDLEARGTWSDCPRCYRSFGSVFEANLTLFQTVVAGDSWGSIAVPVIEYQPWTAVFFVGSLMTLVFGVLNLIVAVIVDVFAESRERDFLNRADELAEEERHQKKLLSQIFDKIDEDGSGSLSYDELVQGAYKVAEFARCLRVMDIDTRDLEQLFNIVDSDGSGEINPEEFIEAMYRMKNADSKTATKFVKHIVTRMDEDNKELKEQMAGLLEHFSQGQSINATLSSNSQGPSIEEELLQRLHVQEQRINQAIETAVSRASQVALQAAMSAATEAASNVMGQVNKESKHLANTVAAKMDLQSVSGISVMSRSFSFSKSADVSRSSTRTGKHEHPRGHNSLMATCLTRFGGMTYRPSGEVAAPRVISAPQSRDELCSAPADEDPSPEVMPLPPKPQVLSSSRSPFTGLGPGPEPGASGSYEEGISYSSRHHAAATAPQSETPQVSTTDSPTESGEASLKPISGVV